MEGRGLIHPAPFTNLVTLNKGNRVLVSSLLQFARRLVKDRKGGNSGTNTTSERDFGQGWRDRDEQKVQEVNISDTREGWWCFFF